MGNAGANKPADAPEWVPDKIAPKCSKCSVEFRTVVRRHHCRNCGGVFCTSCCNQFVPLPHFGYSQAVRTCHECFEKLQQKRKQQQLDQQAAQPAAKPSVEQLNEELKKHKFALEENVNDIAAYVMRAQVFEQLGQFDNALKDYDTVIDEFGVTEPDIYVQRAILLQNVKQDNQKAFQDLSQAIEVDMNYLPAFVLRARLHELRNEIPKAFNDYGTALAINPNDASVYLARAKLFDKRLNDVQQALNDLNKAIELDPNCADAYLQRGTIYEVKMGNAPKALTEYNKGIEADRNHAELYMARARLCKYKLHTNFEEDYSKAIQLEPSLREANHDFS